MSAILMSVFISVLNPCMCSGILCVGFSVTREMKYMVHFERRVCEWNLLDYCCSVEYLRFLYYALKLNVHCFENFLFIPVLLSEKQKRCL